MGKIRVSRFDITEPQKKLVLTQRDRAMIEKIYQRGFLNTTHLVALFSDPDRIDPRRREYSGSQYRTIAQRLRRLQNHKLISTLEAQRRAFVHDFDNDSKVYAATDQAVPVLEAMGYIVPHTNYTEAAQKRQSYQHDLNVSEIFVRCVVGARERNIPYEDSKTLVEAAHASECEKYPFKPKRWELIRFPTEYGTLIPDDLFALITDKTCLFFLEVDRNTEPNVSSQRKKTLKNTLEKYISLYWNKKQVEPYGVDRFRVLLVTKSEQHISNILKLLGTFEAEIFHFATFQHIKACSNMLTLEWRTNKNYIRRIT